MTEDRPEARTDQFELFLPYIADLPLRDQREMMERPFFSLAKGKRIKPIDYQSPDRSLWVHVSAGPEYGMATIWDADILIYCASVLADLARRGHNDIPRKLHLMPYDLLRAIGRPTTGRAYELLGQALDRLVATTVKMNIRAENRREATFSWLDGWTQLVDERTERSRGMTIELSNWFYEGVLMTGGVLSIDRAYFDLTGGRERWLYKVTRKHAGGAGETGFAISMPTLFEKSGAEGPYRRFKFEITKIAQRNELPGFDLSLEVPAGKREPSLRMRRKPEKSSTSSTAGSRADQDAKAKPGPTSSRIPLTPPKLNRVAQVSDQSDSDLCAPLDGEALVDARAFIRRSVSSIASKATAGEITDGTMKILRAEYPGWDYQTLHEEFKAWVSGSSARTPVNYQNAFIGFVRRHDEKNRYTLGR